MKVLHCGNCSFDLDLETMTFTHKLEPYPLETYRSCENELPTSKLSKVIVLQTYKHTYIQTDRQTDTRPQNYIPCHAACALGRT